MATDLHECLTELRRQLGDLLQVESDCLRRALEVSRASGQGAEFDAIMRRMEATRAERGALLKHIHQLEGRDLTGPPQFAGPEPLPGLVPPPPKADGGYSASA